MSSDWIETICSAWTGHRAFAHWLVKRIQPQTVVDLGVDYGYSTFVFADALAGSKGTVYGVDLFQGDVHAGSRDTYEFVMQHVRDHHVTNIEVIKSDFNELWGNITGSFGPWSVFNDFRKIIGSSGICAPIALA